MLVRLAEGHRGGEAADWAGAGRAAMPWGLRVPWRCGAVPLICRDVPLHCRAVAPVRCRALTLCMAVHGSDRAAHAEHVARRFCIMLTLFTASRDLPTHRERGQ